jgi:hypothetical protein
MNKEKIIVSGAAAITILFGVPAYVASAHVTQAQETGYSNLKNRLNKRQTLSQATFGVVTNVEGPKITISRRGALHSIVTVTTNTDTFYKKNGIADSTVVPEVGQNVVVMGSKDSMGNVDSAISVNVLARNGSKIVHS